MTQDNARHRTAASAQPQTAPLGRESAAFAQPRVTWRQIMGYVAASFGNNLVGGIGAMFQSYYFTDALGVKPAMAGAFQTLRTLWDAVNDAFFAGVVDRTNTRWGRYRFYLMTAPFGIALGVLMIYTIPPFGMTGRLIYLMAALLFFEFFSNFMSSSIYASPAMLGNDPKTRLRLVRGSLWGFTMGAFVIALIGYPVLELFGGTQKQGGWWALALLAATGYVVGAQFLARALKRFDTPERWRGAQADRITVRDSLACIFRNGPLLLLVMIRIGIQLAWVCSSAGPVYFFRYYIGNTALISYFLAGRIVVRFLTATVTPPIARALGKKPAFLLGTALGAVFPVWLLLTQSSDVSWIFTMALLSEIGIYLSVGLTFTLILDCMDYAEYKTGRRSDATVMCGFWLGDKAGLALATLLIGLIQSGTGYVANAVQTPSALYGILLVMTVAPIGSAILSTLVMSFYPLTDRRVAGVQNELAARKALHGLKTE